MPAGGNWLTCVAETDSGGGCQIALSKSALIGDVTHFRQDPYNKMKRERIKLSVIK